MGKLIRIAAIMWLSLVCASASATVIITNVTATGTNISFDVVGTITKQGSGFQQQFGFGHVSDPSLDWINSFDHVLSTITATGMSQSVGGLYDLTGQYGETIWTSSPSDFSIGDVVNLHYNLVGSFNLSNFDIAGLGFQNGYSVGPAIEAVNNLATVQVPAPPVLGLMAIALCLIGLQRRTR